MFLEITEIELSSKECRDKIYFGYEKLEIKQTLRPSLFNPLSASVALI